MNEIEEKLAMALRVSSKGICLLTKKGDKVDVSWANSAFFKITGLLKGEAFEANGADVWAGFGGDKTTLAKCLEGKEAWQGSLRSQWSGDFQARLDSIENGCAALWVEREEDEESLRARLEAAIKKVESISTGSERSGFTGPKAFWRSVGAVWTLCSRNEIPVSLGLISISSLELDKKNADDAAKKAIVSTFRRASDVVGRLGMDSSGVFIVGQDPGKAKERFDLLMLQLKEAGCAGNIGLTSGIPERGSSTQTIKFNAKMLMDKSSASGSGFLVYEAFIN